MTDRVPPDNLADNPPDNPSDNVAEAGLVPLPSILRAIRQDGEAFHVAIPESWRQGRTAFGGITAATALRAARLAFPEEAALRSASITFLAPVAGDAVITATVLRKGRSATYIETRTFANDQLAASCVFSFGAPRESALASQAPGPEGVADLPPLPGPEEVASLFPAGLGPAFARNFDMRIAHGAGPVQGAAKGDLAVWARYQDHPEPHDEASVLALCDAPPPAAMGMMRAPAAISTMTWLVTFLTDDFTNDSPWWLIRSLADHVADGYSSQAMNVWTRNGRPIAQGLQTIAVFG